MNILEQMLYAHASDSIQQFDTVLQDLADVAKRLASFYEKEVAKGGWKWQERVDSLNNIAKKIESIIPVLEE